MSKQGTILFLHDLDQNNKREWFQKNKLRYEESHGEMIAFADHLLGEMNQHDVIATNSGRKSLYRIYRDVRFGKDKTPYKTNWGGFMKRAGANRRGGYYYQVGPKGSFVMGGFFGPNAQDLLHIRHQLAQDDELLRAVMESNPFKSYFGELRGNQLKTAPRGFPKDHPDVDLLRYKQFLLRHDFKPEEVFSADFPKTVSMAFGKMRPFLDVMTELLTTDLNGESLQVTSPQIQ
ncbi:MAG: DUF2461 domain-containing protein [Cyclobacteriaceae bacterium]